MGFNGQKDTGSTQEIICWGELLCCLGRQTFIQQFYTQITHVNVKVKRTAPLENLLIIYVSRFSSSVKVEGKSNAWFLALDFVSVAWNEIL